MAQFASGGAFGLVLGLLIGLSASPVVGTIVTALAALLGGLLGLRRAVAPAGGMAPTLAHPGTVVGFGLLCVAGILGGLFIRTNGLLSPSVGTRVHRWEAAGYAPEAAREIVAKMELGAGSTAARGSTQAQGDKREGEPTDHSVLFSDAGRSKCEVLSGGFVSFDAATQLFQKVGGPWARVAQTVQQHGGSPEKGLELLLGLRDAWCKEE